MSDKLPDDVKRWTAKRRQALWVRRWRNQAWRLATIMFWVKAFGLEGKRFRKKLRVTEYHPKIDLKVLLLFVFRKLSLGEF